MSERDEGRMYQRGVTCTHSSFDDGICDLGSSIGLGGGQMLYAGERPDHPRWSICIYQQAGNALQIADGVGVKEGCDLIDRISAAFAAAERERDEARDRALVEAADAAHSRLHPKNHRSDWTDYAKDSAQHAAYARDVILSLRKCTTPAPASDDVRERGGARVEVKPLEWWESDSGDQCCDTLIGRYQIQKGSVRYCLMPAMATKTRSLEYISAPTFHKTASAAKAAAQADYERRILSALRTTPAPASDDVRDKVARTAVAFANDYGPLPAANRGDEAAIKSLGDRLSIRLANEGLQVGAALSALPSPSVAEAAIPTRERLPEKPGLRSYEHVRCLIFVEGEWQIGEWNCEHLVWDDEHGDDFRYNPTEPTHWIPVPPSPTRALASEGGAS